MKDNEQKTNFFSQLGQSRDANAGIEIDGSPAPKRTPQKKGEINNQRKGSFRIDP